MPRKGEAKRRVGRWCDARYMRLRRDAGMASDQEVEQRVRDRYDLVPRIRNYRSGKRVPDLVVLSALVRVLGATSLDDLWNPRGRSQEAD